MTTLEARIAQAIQAIAASKQEISDELKNGTVAEQGSPRWFHLDGMYDGLVLAQWHLAQAMKEAQR